MKKLFVVSAVLVLSIILLRCGPNKEEKQLQNFINSHVEKIAPLRKESNLAYWNAATTGNQEDYKKYSELELKVRQVYSNKEDFEFLKEQKESGRIKDRTLARQLDVLYNLYLENQVEPELLKKIIDLGSEIERKFSTFRATIDGKQVTVNEIKEILKTETDSRKRKKAWLASKQVGPIVADDLIKLVKLRNQAAQNLGFNNFHTLYLTVGEQEVEKLNQIFDELYGLTYKPYTELKTELDSILAAKYNIDITDLMPWHFHDPFFQETPMVYDLNLDVYYEGKDVNELASMFYEDIGLNVESIITNSDLYEREGKNPHAFCTDIDREGDIRILCNLKNNEYWMETMLHELGHAVYDKYHDPKLPFLLREPAHIFTTEAIAKLMERLTRNTSWMEEMLGLSDDQRSEIEDITIKYAKLKQLIFARWSMVMYNFEKALYADPDQDLNSLWWEMVEKYQLVKKPKGRNEPDWAAKIHFTIAPCYYHNYLLGDLLASQLHHYIVYNVLKLNSDENLSYVKQKKIGDFLLKKIFEVGTLYSWNDMITRATGEPLSPKYFVEQYVN